MRQFRAFTLVLVLLLPSWSVRADDAELQASVKTLAHSLSDGYATLHPNDITILHSQSSQDAVALFLLVGLGGGNGSSQYIVFFNRNEPIPGKRNRVAPYRLVAISQVGFRGWRLFNFRTARFRSGAVSIAGRSFLPKDAMCCPSQPIKITISISQGRITEQSGGG